MDYLRIQWDDPNDSDGNVQHIGDNGLDIGEVEAVLENPTSEGTSRSTGRPCVWGTTPDGKYILVVYVELDADTIRVVTAYEVPEPR